MLVDWRKTEQLAAAAAVEGNEDTVGMDKRRRECLAGIRMVEGRAERIWAWSWCYQQAHWSLLVHCLIRGWGG